MRVKYICGCVKQPSINKQAIWNSFSGLLAGLEMAIMTATASRFIDLNAAGMITIAFALGYIFKTIAFWGVRTFQVSDRNDEYSFCVYQTSRFFSMGFMAIAFFLYLLFSYFVKNDSADKLVVISLFQIVFAAESYEDVVWGEYQRRGRIDIGAKLFLIRWGSLLIFFIFSVIVFRKLLPSLVVSIGLSLTFFFLFLKFVFGIPNSDRANYDFHLIMMKTRKLMVATTPLFFITFLSFFLNNVAKYSLDSYYDNDVQALFGFVTTPLFAVEMFSGFIYQPKLSNLSRLWLENHIKEFILAILRQMFYIFIIMVICTVIIYTIGIQILSFLFAIDLTLFRTDLVINVLSGGFIAYLTFACAVLTIMRNQKILLSQYGIASVLGGTLIWTLVKNYGIRGGTIGNLMVFSLQAFSLYVIIFLTLRRNNNLSL
jgi:O-antigen/teichoic acid export membrane protein